MTTRSIALLFAVAALWGSSYTSIKIALDDLPAAWIVIIRVLLGGLVVLPFAIHSKAIGLLKTHWRAIACNGFLQVTVPFMLISVGEQHIHSALAGILVASVPVFTAPIAAAYGSEENISARTVAGIVVGMVGVILLFGLDLSGSKEELLGGSLIVLASISYAISGVFVQRKLHGVHSSVLATGTFLSAVIFTLPIALVQLPSHTPQAETVGAMLLLGIGSTGIAFVMFFTLLKTIGPTRSSTVTYLAPVFAMLYGLLFLNEQVTLSSVAGLCIILVGCLLAMSTKRQRTAA